MLHGMKGTPAAALIGALTAMAFFAFWTCAMGAENTGSTRPAPLPRVRVAADGRGFVTSEGRPFAPFGVNYYRPGTGWAPQVWKKYDAAAARRDLRLLRSMGGNCVRVFLSFGSFYSKPGALDAEGLEKFDDFLAAAEEAGVYVHPTGPDHWEGLPQWAGTDRYADETVLAAIVEFWKLFAARYRGRTTIFAYDLLNEPAVRWDTPPMRRQWAEWVIRRYGSAAGAARAWGVAEETLAGGIAIPKAEDKPVDPMLLDYQRFREDIADRWTRRQAEAIRAADRDALVTVGFIQWSVPAVLPRADVYSGFRPQRQAQYLDFLEIHFYPLAGGAYQYDGAERESLNLAYLEAVVRETALPGKPVVIAEFGWYGGGTFPMGGRQSREASEEDQAGWCEKLIRTTAPLACGWLNWGFYDHPGARDVSVRTGLLMEDGREKAWGRKFRLLAAEYQAHRAAGAAAVERPALPWDRCITSPRAAGEFLQEYAKVFRQATDSGGKPRE